MDAGGPGTIGLAMFKGAVALLSFTVAAYPFYRVVSMWIEKSLEAHEAVLYLGTLLMLFVGSIAAWGTPLGWLLLSALFTVCLGLPLLNRIADKMALRQMEDEDVRNFTATLQQQPHNTYYRERLAKILLARKQYELALTQLDLALQSTPKDRNLERLRERVETERRRAVERLKVCPKCTTEHPPEAAVCVQCGFPFMDPADLLRLLWTPEALAAAKWGGVGMLALGLLLLALHMNLTVVTLILFFAIVSIFWYGYVHLSQL